MKVKLDWDERYPDFTASLRGAGLMEIEMTEQEYADWLVVDKEYGAWQGYFAKKRKEGNR